MSESNSSDEIFLSIADVVLGRYDASSSAKSIAEKITSQPLDTLESQLSSLWNDILGLAAGDGDQRNLVEFVVALSQLPDVVDDQGNTVQVHGGTVWKDLPMFGWEINSVWNNFSPPPPTQSPESTPTRSEAITHHKNQIRFTAALTHTPHQIFTPFRLQILWTFRALETPTSWMRDTDVSVPAIAAAVSVLGGDSNDLKSWTDDYTPSDPKKQGHPGRGGPLWKGGKEGFCLERYEVWKRRLGEIADDEDVEEGVRRVAAEAERGM